MVYFPLAHMVWGVDGLMNGVWNAKAGDQGDRLRRRHRRAHVLGLVGAGALPDPRQAHGLRQGASCPHSMVLSMVGTGMLWVGWYGFNAGSAVAADGIAANAFTTTTLATAVAAFVWPLIEWITRGKPTILGFCSGAVAGLVVITPAAGFVTPSSAVIIGVLAGVVPVPGLHQAQGDLRVRRRAGHLRRARRRRHHGRLRDRHPRHARRQRQPQHQPEPALVGKTLWIEQLKAMGFTMVLSIGATVVIAYAVKAVLGLRPEPRGRGGGPRRHRSRRGRLSPRGGWLARPRSRSRWRCKAATAFAKTAP